MESKRGTINNHTGKTAKKYKNRIYSYLTQCLLTQSSSFGNNDGDFQSSFCPSPSSALTPVSGIPPALWIWTLCLVNLDSASKGLPLLIPVLLEALYFLGEDTVLHSSFLTLIPSTNVWPLRTAKSTVLSSKASFEYQIQGWRKGCTLWFIRSGKLAYLSIQKSNDKDLCMLRPNIQFWAILILFTDAFLLINFIIKKYLCYF